MPLLEFVVRSSPVSVALLLLVLLFAGSAPAAERAVISLREMRQERAVVQQWDLSCGAPALATLLTYQRSDPVHERDIARAAIKREEYLANPALVRVRRGCSLFDLQRYVDGHGYEGIPLGNMTYQDLLARAR